MEHMRTENEYLKNQIARTNVTMTKQLEIANIKCDILFQEMLKFVEEGERVALTFSNQEAASWQHKITQIE